MQIQSRRNAAVTTWANRPALADYPPFTPIFFTDIGNSLTQSNRGSQWFHDGQSWRPAAGCQLLYTHGSVIVNKTGTTTAEEILGQCVLPAGLLATANHRLVIVHTMGKDTTTGSATYGIRLGTAGTLADDLIINAVVASPTGTSLQGQTERTFTRTSATSLDQPFNGASAYGTTTLAQQTPITVPNLDSNNLFLSFTGYISTGATIVSLRQFDVYIKG